MKKFILPSAICFSLLILTLIHNTSYAVSTDPVTDAPQRPPITRGVDIDIKPGEDPAKINPKSNGKIEVAILSSHTFDATTVNTDTVYFGILGTEAHGDKPKQKDVNKDGLTDMVFQFNTQDTGIQCGAIFGSLTGVTLSGEQIQGFDSFVTVGCNGNDNDNEQEDDKKENKGKSYKDD